MCKIGANGDVREHPACFLQVCMMLHYAGLKALNPIAICLASHAENMSEDHRQGKSMMTQHKFVK
jgi:hypothetical protein